VKIAAHPPSTGSRFPIISYGTDSDYFELLYWKSDSSPNPYQLVLSDKGATQQINWTLPLNTWQHVCATNNGTTTVLYINGSAVHTASHELANVTTASKLQIGERVTTDSYYFNGAIDDVRIYNNALTSDQIRQLAVQVPAGLVARYDFTDNGTTGDALKDVSGWGQTLTNTGSAPAGMNRFAYNGSAFNLNGSQYLSVTGTVLPTGNSGRTMCAWYRSNDRPASAITYPMLLHGSGGTPNTSHLLAFRNTSGVHQVASGFWSADAVFSYSEYNTWNLICGVHNHSNPQINKLYLNGLEVANNTTSNTLDITSHLLNIGYAPNSTSYFKGTIDDVMLWNRPLTALEILSLVPQPDSVQIVSFNQEMDQTVIPAFTAKAYNGSGWVEIPTTNSTLSWVNGTTLRIDLSWLRLPENTRIEFTISGLQKSGGTSIADRVFEISTTGRNTYSPIADSGQTGCFYFDGSAWKADPDCNGQTYTEGDTNKPKGQDGHYINMPNSRNFTGPTNVSTSYITTDHVTSLIWKSCSEGLSGDACGTGTANTMTWYDAINACSSLNSASGYAGIKTWRLPTASELITLGNYLNSVTNPATDTASFPATVASHYWSSTANPGSLAQAWYMDFSDGDYGFDIFRTESKNVRCVSGFTNSIPVKGYVQNGNSSVTDLATGLEWQRCSHGQTADGTCSGTIASVTWVSAVGYCEGLSLNSQEDWRLPNITELGTLVNSTRTAPSINTQYFPNTPDTNVYWWSSTTYSDTDAGGSIAYQWVTGFLAGDSTIDLKTDSNFVRCVRGP
jgi:hypothetical protein